MHLQPHLQLLEKLFAVIVRSPARSILLLLLNAPFVVIAKLLKLLNALKVVLVWVKSSVRIKFKLADETVPVLEISSSKFVTPIVTVAALTVPVLAKVLAVKFPLLVTVIFPLLAKSAATILTLPETVSVSLRPK